MNSHHFFPKSFLVAMLLGAWTGFLGAQVVPATPKKFTTRMTGGGGASDIGVATIPKPQEKTVRTITYVSLSETRQWKSSEGKTLLGKLIAFEDLVVETKISANAQPSAATPPPMPEKPTVVRDAKARLLIDSKPYELPLDRLSDDDQKFIENIRVSITASSAKKN
ncbi:MAG: hypothetical protein WCN98_08960 [Verrucomicrobiaceae bacterium]